MRKVFVSCLLLIVNLVYSQAKENSNENVSDYKIEYQLNYQPNKENKDIKESEMMYLYISNGKSKFGSEGKIKGDSIMSSQKGTNKSRSNFMQLMSKIPETKFDYIIYKNVPEGSITFIQNIFKDWYKYKIDMKIFEWEILPETQNYKGFKIQKAKTNFAGRKYEAWFTTEIPISEGPYKFNGLPGLILKLNDQKAHYVFEMIGVKKLNRKLNLETPNKNFISTSKTELKELVEDDKNNPMKAIESSGISIGFSEKQKKELKKSRMFRNNPIELE